MNGTTFNLRGITTTEKLDSFRLDGTTCTRLFQCAWTDRFVLREALIGSAVSPGSAYKCQPYVTFLGNAGHWSEYKCVACGIAGQGAMTNPTPGTVGDAGPGYTQALLTAQFELWNSVVGDIEVALEREDEAYLMPPGFYHYDGGSVPIIQPVPIIIPITAYRFTRWVSWNIFKTAVNYIFENCGSKVNLAGVTNFGPMLLNFTKAETVLVCSPGSRCMYKYDVAGYELDITLKLKQQCTWNQVWRPEVGWTKVSAGIYSSIGFTSTFGGLSLKDICTKTDAELHQKPGS